MTNEEAIKIIKECKDKKFNRTLYTLDEYHTAMDMAIEALGQEPCEKYLKEIDHLRKYISKLETQIVEQEPYEYKPFTINIDKLKDEDIQKFLREFKNQQVLVVTNDYLPPVTPQPEKRTEKHTETHACDCISRQAVLDIVDGYSESKSNVEDVTQDIISDIMALPSITPQPKMGHWEWIQYDSNSNIGNWHCSECRGICTEMHSIEDAYNYCPNCGAKMEEEEE